MRHADHRAFHHAGQGINLAFHFLGIDIEAAGNHQILAPPHDRDIAIRVDDAEITGDEEAVGAEFGFGLFRHAPIAFEDIGAAHFDHADLSLRQGAAGFGIGDADLDPRQRQTHRSGNTRAVIGIRRVHVGFGHAVAFEDGVAGARLPVAMGLAQKRRRTRDEQAHVLRRLPRQARIGQQPGIESRHAHHHCRLRHQPEHLVHLRPGQEQHGGARHQHRVGRHEQSMGVIDRKRMQQHVAIRELPEPRQGRGHSTPDSRD